MFLAPGMKTATKAKKANKSFCVLLSWCRCIKKSPYPPLFKHLFIITSGAADLVAFKTVIK